MQNFLPGLANDPVFGKLSRADHNELLTMARRKQYQRGEYICWQDESWPKVAYIASGAADWVIASPEGKRQVVFRLDAGKVVWGHSLFDDRPMPASLEAVKPAELYLWPREVVVPVVSRNVEAVWATGTVLVDWMRHVREVVYGFAFHPVAGRLARLLLTHYRDAGEGTAPRDLSLDQMAEAVGSTPELVSRTLHRFANEGLIRVNRVEITFTDRAGLEELVGQS